MNSDGLELRGISRSYGSRKAVDSLSISVGQGEIFGLLGPNGAGKTTTLKIIAGLIIPHSGEVLLNGTSVDSIREKIVYVPDEPTIFNNLSGREYLLYSGRMRALDRDLLDARIESCIKVFEMEGWIDHRSGSYSHGMIQRVVLSGAFIARPDLYVIDEPLVGLDPPAAATFWKLVEEAAKQGASVIISTHTLTVASVHCSRFGIIHRGILKRTLSAGELSGQDLQDLFFSVTGTAPAAVESVFSDF